MIVLLKNFITIVTTLTAVLLAVRELKKAFDSFRRESDEDKAAGKKEIGTSKDQMRRGSV